MVGYGNSSRVYKIWDPVTRKIITSRDVVFEENLNHENYSELQELDYYSLLPLSTDGQMPEPLLDEQIPMDQPDVNMGTDDGASQPNDPVKDGLGEAELNETNGETEEEFFHGFDPVADPVGHLRRSLRTAKPSEKYLLYRGYHATAPRHRTSTDQPEKKIYGKLNITLSAALSSPQGPLWKTAVEDELNSLHKNETWELVPLPPRRTPIKSKWIFELKPGYDGVAERYKARLVNLGCSQRDGLDYNEKFGLLFAI
jgi:hypothetical protein